MGGIRPVRGRNIVGSSPTSLTWNCAIDKAPGRPSGAFWPGGVTGKHAVLKKPCLTGVRVQVPPWLLTFAFTLVVKRTSRDSAKIEVWVQLPAGVLAAQKGVRPLVLGGQTPFWAATGLDAGEDIARRVDVASSGRIVPPTRPRATAAYACPSHFQFFYLRGVPERTRLSESRGPGSIPGEDTRAYLLCR
jgi:hypothetical protein